MQAESFEVIYGGGEAVAITLANFGLESYYVTKLPGNPLGQAALSALRRQGLTRITLPGEESGWASISAKTEPASVHRW